MKYKYCEEFVKNHVSIDYIILQLLELKQLKHKMKVLLDDEKKNKLLITTTTNGIYNLKQQITKPNSKRKINSNYNFDNNDNKLYE